MILPIGLQFQLSLFICPIHRSRSWCSATVIGSMLKERCVSCAADQAVACSIASLFYQGLRNVYTVKWQDGYT